MRDVCEIDVSTEVFHVTTRTGLESRVRTVIADIAVEHLMSEEVVVEGMSDR